LRALERLWWSRPARPWDEAWLWPLSLASLAWRAGAGLDRACARPFRAPVPVISVGNLAVGGTGKTPVALLLCERLRALGRRPALLSGGYGGRAGAGPLWVSRGEGLVCEARDCGDEAALAARSSPWLLVLAGSDRVASARAAVEAGADLLLLDDGLQHHRLARDLDVVVVDARSPLGNGRLLPRGPLREGTGAFGRLGGRGLLWLTGAAADRGVPASCEASLEPLLAAARAARLAGPVESRFVLRAPAWLRGARVHLLAGIARPERFEESVRAAGAEVAGRSLFADHHAFTVEELRRAALQARDAGARLVTTSKDAQRLPEGFEVEVLPGEAAVVSGEPVLAEALERLLGSGARHPSTGLLRPYAADGSFRAPGGLRARLLLALGAAAGALAWTLGVRRGVVRENLARAFPDQPPAAREALARGCYRSLGRTLAEVLLARSLGAEEVADWVGIDGLDRLQAALDQGRGAVCALAHFGNWELVGLACGRAGFPLVPIVRALRGRANRWLLRARDEAGLGTLAERGVSGQALAVLQQNKVLGILVDQNMLRRRGVFVDFFGTPACTTPAAAVYALRGRAPLLAAFPVRQTDGTHRVQIVGPLHPPKGLSGHAAVVALTQEVTRELERAVRAHPEQWLWLHRRWKTRP
jgi:tetraacyldisaccharide 4'-kinase